MLEILYKDRQVLAVKKPAGTPSQPDPTGAPDAMSLAKAALADQGESSDLWLVHRLDRVVGGILIFARTKAAAGELSSLFATHGAQKCYLAVTEGEAPAGELCDLLYKDAAKGKAFVVDRARAGVKEAKLIAEPLDLADTAVGPRGLVRVTLLTGRYARSLPLAAHPSSATASTALATRALECRRFTPTDLPFRYSAGITCFAPCPTPRLILGRYLIYRRFKNDRKALL